MENSHHSRKPHGRRGNDKRLHIPESVEDQKRRRTRLNIGRNLFIGSSSDTSDDTSSGYEYTWEEAEFFKAVPCTLSIRGIALPGLRRDFRTLVPLKAVFVMLFPNNTPHELTNGFKQLEMFALTTNEANTLTDFVKSLYESEIRTFTVGQHIYVAEFTSGEICCNIKCLRKKYEDILDSLVVKLTGTEVAKDTDSHEESNEILSEDVVPTSNHSLVEACAVLERLPSKKWHSCNSSDSIMTDSSSSVSSTSVSSSSDSSSEDAYDLNSKKRTIRGRTISNSGSSTSDETDVTNKKRKFVVVLKHLLHDEKEESNNESDLGVDEAILKSLSTSCVDKDFEKKDHLNKECKDDHDVSDSSKLDLAPDKTSSVGYDSIHHDTATLDENGTDSSSISSESVDRVSTSSKGSLCSTPLVKGKSDGNEQIANIQNSICDDTKISCSDVLVSNTVFVKETDKKHLSEIRDQKYKYTEKDRKCVLGSNHHKESPRKNKVTPPSRRSETVTAKKDTVHISYRKDDKYTSRKTAETRRNIRSPRNKHRSSSHNSKPSNSPHSQKQRDRLRDESSQSSSKSSAKVTDCFSRNGPKISRASSSDSRNRDIVEKCRIRPEEMYGGSGLRNPALGIGQRNTRFVPDYSKLRFKYRPELYSSLSSSEADFGDEEEPCHRPRYKIRRTRSSRDNSKLPIRTLNKYKYSENGTRYERVLVRKADVPDFRRKTHSTDSSGNDSSNRTRSYKNTKGHIKRYTSPHCRVPVPNTEAQGLNGSTDSTVGVMKMDTVVPCLPNDIDNLVASIRRRCDADQPLKNQTTKIPQSRRRRRSHSPSVIRTFPLSLRRADDRYRRRQRSLSPAHNRPAKYYNKYDMRQKAAYAFKNTHIYPDSAYAVPRSVRLNHFSDGIDVGSFHNTQTQRTASHETIIQSRNLAFKPFERIRTVGKAGNEYAGVYNSGLHDSSMYNNFTAGSSADTNTGSFGSNMSSGIIMAQIGSPFMPLAKRIEQSEYRFRPFTHQRGTAQELSIGNSSTILSSQKNTNPISHNEEQVIILKDSNEANEELWPFLSNFPPNESALEDSPDGDVDSLILNRISKLRRKRVPIAENSIAERISDISSPGSTPECSVIRGSAEKHAQGVICVRENESTTIDAIPEHTSYKIISSETLAKSPLDLVKISLSATAEKVRFDVQKCTDTSNVENSGQSKITVVEKEASEAKLGGVSQTDEGNSGVEYSIRGMEAEVLNNELPSNRITEFADIASNCNSSDMTTEQSRNIQARVINISLESELSGKYLLQTTDKTNCTDECQNKDAFNTELTTTASSMCNPGTKITITAQHTTEKLKLCDSTSESITRKHHTDVSSKPSNNRTLQTIDQVEVYSKKNNLAKNTTRGSDVKSWKKILLQKAQSASSTESVTSTIANYGLQPTTQIEARLDPVVVRNIVAQNSITGNTYCAKESNVKLVEDNTSVKPKALTEQTNSVEGSAEMEHQPINLSIDGEILASVVQTIKDSSENTISSNVIRHLVASVNISSTSNVISQSPTTNSTFDTNAVLSKPTITTTTAIRTEHVSSIPNVPNKPESCHLLSEISDDLPEDISVPDVDLPIETENKLNLPPDDQPMLLHDSQSKGASDSVDTADLIEIYVENPSKTPSTVNLSRYNGNSMAKDSTKEVRIDNCPKLASLYTPVIQKSPESTLCYGDVSKPRDSVTSSPKLTSEKTNGKNVNSYDDLLPDYKCSKANSREPVIQKSSESTLCYGGVSKPRDSVTSSPKLTSDKTNGKNVNSYDDLLPDYKCSKANSRKLRESSRKPATRKQSSRRRGIKRVNGKQKGRAKRRKRLPSISSDEDIIEELSAATSRALTRATSPISIHECTSSPEEGSDDDLVSFMDIVENESRHLHDSNVKHGSDNAEDDYHIPTTISTSTNKLSVEPVVSNSNSEEEDLKPLSELAKLSYKLEMKNDIYATPDNERLPDGGKGVDHIRPDTVHGNKSSEKNTNKNETFCAVENDNIFAKFSRELEANSFNEMSLACELEKSGKNIDAKNHLPGYRFFMKKEEPIKTLLKNDANLQDRLYDSAPTTHSKMMKISEECFESKTEVCRSDTKKIDCYEGPPMASLGASEVFKFPSKTTAKLQDRLHDTRSASHSEMIKTSKIYSVEPEVRLPDATNNNCHVALSIGPVPQSSSFQNNARFYNNDITPPLLPTPPTSPVHDVTERKSENTSQTIQNHQTSENSGIHSYSRKGIPHTCMETMKTNIMGVVTSPQQVIQATKLSSFSHHVQESEKFSQGKSATHQKPVKQRNVIETAAEIAGLKERDTNPGSTNTNDISKMITTTMKTRARKPNQLVFSNWSMPESESSHGFLEIRMSVQGNRVFALRRIPYVKTTTCNADPVYTHATFHTEQESPSKSKSPMTTPHACATYLRLRDVILLLKIHPEALFALVLRCEARLFAPNAYSKKLYNVVYDPVCISDATMAKMTMQNTRGERLQEFLNHMIVLDKFLHSLLPKFYSSALQIQSCDVPKFVNVKIFKPIPNIDNEVVKIFRRPYEYNSTLCINDEKISCQRMERRRFSLLQSVSKKRPITNDPLENAKQGRLTTTENIPANSTFFVVQQPMPTTQNVFTASNPQVLYMPGSQQLRYTTSGELNQDCSIRPVSGQGFAIPNSLPNTAQATTYTRACMVSSAPSMNSWYSTKPVDVLSPQLNILPSNQFVTTLPGSNVIRRLSVDNQCSTSTPHSFTTDRRTPLLDSTTHSSYVGVASNSKAVMPRDFAHTSYGGLPSQYTDQPMSDSKAPVPAKVLISSPEVEFAITSVFSLNDKHVENKNNASYSDVTENSSDEDVPDITSSGLLTTKEFLMNASKVFNQKNKEQGESGLVQQLRSRNALLKTGLSETAHKVPASASTNTNETGIHKKFGIFNSMVTLLGSTPLIFKNASKLKNTDVERGILSNVVGKLQSRIGAGENVENKKKRKREKMKTSE